MNDLSNIQRACVGLLDDSEFNEDHAKSDAISIMKFIHHHCRVNKRTITITPVPVTKDQPFATLVQLRAE